MSPWSGHPAHAPLWLAVTTTGIFSPSPVVTPRPRAYADAHQQGGDMNVKGLIRQFSGSRTRGTGTGTAPVGGTRRRGGTGSGGEEVVRGVRKLLRNRRR